MTITLSSERILEQVEEIIKRLEYAEKENNKNEVELLWYIGIIMLRSIGHILQNVDSNKYINLSSKIKNQFDKDKTDYVYNFIRDERNFLLKENKNKLEEDSTFCTESGDNIITESGDNIVIPTHFFVEFLGKSLNPSKVLGIGLDFWKDHIDKIKN